MLFTKTSWQDVIGTNIVKQTISAGGTATGDINCKGNPAYLKVSIKVVIAFGSSPNNSVIVNLYGLDSTVVKKDTVPIWSQKIDPVANNEEIVTIPNVDVMTIDHIRVEVKNNNSSESINTWASYLAVYNQ